MPNVKDQSTVDAIAREFTSNNRNKTQAMLVVGYGKGYSDTGRGQNSVFGNIRVKAAIAKIDAKSTKKAELTIATVLADLDWGIAQARRKSPPDLQALARFSELRGKYLSMFSEAGNNSATGLHLNFSTRPKIALKGPDVDSKARTGSGSGPSAKTA